MAASALLDLKDSSLSLRGAITLNRFIDNMVIMSGGISTLLIFDNRANDRAGKLTPCSLDVRLVALL